MIDSRFFFQAEDAIRVHCVTGVQTCALPISGRPRGPPMGAPPSPVWARAHGATSAKPNAKASERAIERVGEVERECMCAASELSKVSRHPAPGEARTRKGFDGACRWAV